MFDELLQLVKDHVGNNPQVAAAIPPEQADAIHQEIATHLQEGLLARGVNGNGLAGSTGGTEDLLSMLSSSLQSGNLVTSSISGGLVGCLSGKFGLPPAVTGAIAASLPGLLQRLENRV